MANINKDLKQERKHNHKLTDLLKVFLFALVMLMPFTAVASTIGYMAFNRNAELPTQETTKIVEHKPQTNEVNSEEDLIEGNWYVYEPNVEDSIFATAIYIPQGTDTYFENNLGIMVNGGYDGDYYLEIDLNGPVLTIYQNIYFKYKYYEWVEIDLNYIVTLTEEELALIPSTYETTTIVVQENANAFYYACNQVAESNLFTWTKNTGTYIAINGLTTGLEINNTFFPVLLTYWTLITCIYIIIDIILKMFTTITHLIVGGK